LTVKPEQKLFQDLKKQLEKAKKQIHLVRVENLIEQGTPDLQRTQKDERLKLFEGSGTKDVGMWSPVMELPFPFPVSRYSSPVPASRSVFPFVEIFDFIKNKYRL
jgi:hypothetical protein